MWAAGLAPEVVILDSEYEGGGAGIRLALQLCAYTGINGSVHAGMTAHPRREGFPGTNVASRCRCRRRDDYRLEGA